VTEHCECCQRESQRGMELVNRDGWMCEEHPGVEFPHDDCAGPGMPWVVEGKDAILALRDKADRGVHRMLEANEVIGEYLAGWDGAIEAVRAHIQDLYKTANWIEDRHGFAAAQSDYFRANATASGLTVLIQKRPKEGCSECEKLTERG
jgi:hypothetical protein